MRDSPVDAAAGTRRALKLVRSVLLAVALAFPAAAFAAIGVNKTFNPVNVSAGQTSTLTVILINNNPAAATGTTFADSFPGSVVVANPANASTTCALGAVTAVPGAPSFSFAGGTIPAAAGLVAGTCTVQVDVVSPAAGVFINTIPAGAVTSSQGASAQAASATLTVAALRAVTGAKAFNPTFLHGSTTLPAPTSRITITLTNPNGVALAGATLTDTVPAGISIAPAPNPTTTCGAGTVSTAATSATLTGGTIPANGNCNFQFDVVATNPNAYANGAVTNTIAANALTTTQGVTNAAAFSANVTLQTGARVEKSFAPTPITTGGTSTLTVTVRNFNTSPLTGVIAFSDPFLGTMRVAGPVTTGGTCLPPMTFTPAPIAGDASFTVSNGSLPGATIGVNSNANCTVTINVTATNAGVNPSTITNTIPVGNFGGVGYSSAGANLVVTAVTSVGGSKSFSPTPILQGRVSTLTITLTNSAAVAANITSFTDLLTTLGASPQFTVAAAPAATTTCGGAVIAAPGGTSITLGAGNAIPAGGNCTITVPVQASATASTGARTNSIAQGALVTSQGRTQTAITGVLTVNPVLSVAKAFAPATVAAGADTRLTITLTDAAGGPAISGLAFTDTLPAGHVVSATPNLVNNCGGAVTAVSGSGTVSLAGGSLAGGVAATSCTILVNITTPAGAGAPTNTIAANTITSTQGFTNPAAGSAVITRVVTNVTLNKSFSPATVLVGGVSTLTINILNNNANAVALTTTGLIDTLPVGMAVAAAPLPVNTCGGALTAAAGAGTITLTGGSLAANATCSIQVHVVANASGNLIDTLGAGLFTSAQGVTNPLAASATLAATGSADLSVTKTDGVASVVPGTSTTYTIVAKNNGPNNVAGAGVVDNPPAGMTFTGWTCVASVGSACGNASGSGPINELVTLINGGTATYTVTAAIASSATGTITNTATVVVPGTVIDTVPGNNTASDTDTLTPQADLVITKTDGVASVNAGGATTYTIVVGNAGPSNANGAIFRDAAVANLNVTGVTCGSPTGGAACPTVPNTTVALMQGAGIVVPTLPAGGSVTFTVNASVPSGASGSISNVATVAAPAGVTDPTPANNTATDTDTITVSADLAITKNDGVASVVPGSSTNYTIIVTNNGPSNVTGATVADILPAIVTSDTFTAVGSGGASGFTAAGSGNINDVVNLPVGATITYTLHANISSSASGTLVNTATVTPPGGVSDPTPGNNSSTDTDTLTAQADLAITKTDGVASVVPGTVTTYTIVATNNGPSNVTGATVADAMPAAIASDTYTAVATGGATGFTASGSGNINDIVNMPVGATITYTVIANVASDATGSLANTATVAVPPGTTDPNPGNNTATDTDSLTPQVTLQVVKNDGTLTYTPGGTAIYTVTVTNTGASDATSVTVTDLLPPGLTLTANVSCTANGAANCAAFFGSIGGTSFGTAGATIAAGAGNSLVFMVPVAFASGMTTDPLTNTAFATDLATGSNASGSDTDNLATQVTLAVVKTDGSATYTPGGTAIYTVTITHGGLSDATNVTVTDPLPAGVTLTANASCVPTGAASCGVVTGVTGQSAFGTTGATIAAGLGNSLVFTAPVAFAPGMATAILDNTASAVDVLSGATGADTDSDTRSPQVTLAVSKTDNSATYTPGGSATYLVGVANTGVSDALNVTVNDNLPVGVTLASNATCVASGIATCGAVTGATGQAIFGTTGAQIAAGAGNFLTFTVPVSFAPSLADNPLTNTATAQDLSSGATGSAFDNDTLAAQADLSITKTDGVVNVTPGTATTYTIVVTNNGPSDVTAASVTDVMPAAIASDTFTAVATGGASGFTASGSGNINDTVNVPAGGTITYTVVANISGSASGTLANTATVTPPAGVTDPNPANNSATDTDTLSAQADLAITKSDGVVTVVPGTTTTYTIVVTNNGPSDVIGATVDDVLPAAIVSDTFTAVGTGGASGFTASGGGNINDTVNMPSGSAITYTLAAAISGSASGTLSNTATVTVPAGVTDTNPGNNSATDTDTLSAQADLAITKTDGVANVSAPGTTTYTIVVSNLGPSDAIGATVSDVLPAAIASDTFTAVATGGVSGFTGAGSGNINDTVNMPAGSTITYTIVANISGSASGILSNTATVTAPAGVVDTNPANNSATDTDTITVIPMADLGITKSDGSVTYTPGNPITYTIVVSNAGPLAVSGATVADAVPAAITGVNWTCTGAAGGTCPASGSGNINASVDLPVGGSVTFTLTGTVAPAASGNLVNTATVTPPAGIVDPNPGNNTATDTDTPTIVAGLVITKTDGSATYTPGDNGVYTITVTNNGPSNANSVSVTDNLPSGVTLSASATCVASGTATCGTVTGTSGGSAFTATGATIAAGAGNSLVFALPVHFASNLFTNPLVNIATASDPASVSVASASDSNALAQGPATPVPADNRWALALLAGFMLLAAWRRSRRVSLRRQT